MILAGVDLSLTRTGCVVLDERARLVTTFTLNSKGLDGPARLAWIRDALHDALLRFGVEQVFVENYAFSRGGKAFVQGELGGVMRLWWWEHHHPYTVVAPTTLKKFVSGKGNVKKDRMLEQTYKRWGVGSDTLVDDNQVDAYGLARLGLACNRLPDGVVLTKPQLECVAKVGEPVFNPPKVGPY